METGRTAAARALLEKLAKSQPHPYILGRLAHVAWRSGDHAAAERLFAAAQGARPGDPVQASWVAVQRAVFERERGRFGEAKDLVARALTLRPAYHPAEELQPEIERLAGDAAAAERSCRALLAKGSAVEVSSTLADLLRAKGDAAQADRILADTTRSYEDLHTAFPEAVARDLARFYMRHGRSLERARELARHAFADRQTAESLRVLGEAELRAGALDNASEAVTRALEMGDRTARLLLLASKIRAAKGDASDAATHRREALRLNPEVERLPP